jgi:hypothetical protein
MAEKSTGELLIETTKVFIWPALLVVGALWLGDELKEILKNRNWKIGIVEVGERIELR